MVIISSLLEIFRSQNTKDSKNDMKLLVYVVVKFDTIYSKLSYRSSKV